MNYFLTLKMRSLRMGLISDCNCYEEGGEYGVPSLSTAMTNVASMIAKISYENHMFGVE